MRIFVPGTFKRRGKGWASAQTPKEKKKKRAVWKTIKDNARQGNSHYIIVPDENPNNSGN